MEPPTSPSRLFRPVWFPTGRAAPRPTVSQPDSSAPRSRAPPPVRGQEPQDSLSDGCFRPGRVRGRRRCGSSGDGRRRGGGRRTVGSTDVQDSVAIRTELVSFGTCRNLFLMYPSPSVFPWSRTCSHIFGARNSEKMQKPMSYDELRAPPDLGSSETKCSK